MSALWNGLSALSQDILMTLALLLPALIVGALVLRGYAPWPLVRAILWRFRVASALFVLLIAISVGMGIGLLAQERGLRRGTAQAADKFDLVVAAPGSEMSVMMAAVFLQPSDMPLLDGETYAEVAGHENVSIAAPLAFGDSFGTSPVIGTTAEFARYLAEDRIEGRMWQSEHEALVGALVPLAIGEEFTPAHGHGDAAEEHAHDGAHLEVVGRLAASGTPWDRAILLPVEAIWEVHGVSNGHAPERADQIGPPFDPAYFPGTPAIVVRSEALWANYALRSEFTRDRETMAFFPGAVLAQLYRVLGDIRQIMSLMALVTQGLVASAVLLGLFILSRLLHRQIALLRALGATARFVFAVIWSFGAALLLAGSALGLLTGVAAASVLSKVVTARTDVLVTAPLGWGELHVLAAFVSVTLLLSLVPAAFILRQPVVPSLRA
ncbi:FtsX-like permease family protein [Pseudooceanicola nanhaiensis]|uniref:FtsX-like permease family protein n=1 Tax=Pseudooceanicola nanhaiensis TaxID=375761 RepID=UPI001CD66E46|nr:FtsX-like permease family protein [Pseudooceanicola nanhaiensis]MCA0919626.1 FtsX-like permease family protein [Pseudooceanicola nanhaiensis]